MADDTTTTTRFHVHRRYDNQPVRRYAFTVDFDSAATSGYRIVDHDPAIADPSYLAKFDSHMAKPQYGVTTGGIDGGIAYTESTDEAPGTRAHYTSAVRSFRAAIMPFGRSR